MYSQPDMTDATDRLAHMLSEMHNDSAPIGWHRYRSLASMLMSKFPIDGIVVDERFFDPMFQPGKSPTPLTVKDSAKAKIVADAWGNARAGLAVIKRTDGSGAAYRAGPSWPIVGENDELLTECGSHAELDEWVETYCANAVLRAIADLVENLDDGPITTKAVKSYIAAEIRA